MSIDHKTTSAMASLLQEWNVWETQALVLFSLMLQIFLFLTGRLRQNNTSRLLKVSTWLAYVGADSVAIYALGLYSQYEDRYKLGRQPFGDTLPFLWIPFLLVHLGGQDSITAFSIEDNNLWLRHLLNLVVQGALALYVFWKSFYRINYSVLVPAMFMFAAGIIKYGERAWALNSASRDSLGNSVKFNNPRGENTPDNTYSSKASYAHQTVLLAQGLFVGRTVLQLGDKVQQKFQNDFQSYGQGEEKLEIVMMELCMMFDLLYTKAKVLQRWIGVMFRCVAQILTVAAFVLFLKIEKHAHNRVNVAISYTLFIGAIFTEACSVSAVIASPWTKAHLDKSKFLHGLYNIFSSLFNAIQCNRRRRTSCSMGQFNFMDYSISQKSKPRMSKTISAIGLEKQWRNLCCVHHIDVSKDGIIRSILDLVNRLSHMRTGQLHLDRRRLNYTLSLPFEHALYRLHMYTDLHISRHFGQIVDPTASRVMQLKEECETLSNYMMYLIVVHPSMLPVSTAAEDLEPGLAEWLGDKYHGEAIKLDILQEYTRAVLGNETYSGSPFEPAQEQPFPLEESLEAIKEVWLTLLVYAAGKCRGEIHARQLGNGGELITFTWLLMVHHGHGDVARELSLLTSDDPGIADVGSLVSVGNSSWIQNLEQPRYAFDFRGQQNSPPEAERMMSHNHEILHLLLQQLSQDVLGAPVGVRVVVEDGTSGEVQQFEAGTQSEID